MHIFYYKQPIFSKYIGIWQYINGVTDIFGSGIFYGYSNYCSQVIYALN